METIFALSSARGKAGVAVIRISGPYAVDAAQCFVQNLPSPKQAALRKIISPEGEHLDTALVLFFPKGASYTGFDTVEFHVHGGIATVKSVLLSLSSLNQLKMAEPGEFTLQALINGRMDLTEIEGLGDLIQAETEVQRRQAMKLFTGVLSQKVKSWRSTLIKSSSLLEASLDFSDEDLPSNLLKQCEENLISIIRSLQDEIKGYKAAERIREGFEVAIVGAPNTGKSTLLNFLARRDAAIVSEQPGTTRDVIEIRMDLSGLPVTFLDLAGIRETLDPIEQMGVNRACERARDADLRIFLQEKGKELKQSPDFKSGDIIRLTKADLIYPPPSNGISGKTGFGVNALKDCVVFELETRSQTAMTAAHARQVAAIKSTVNVLNSAVYNLQTEDNPEIASEDVRISIRELETLIGYVDIEDILDEIFVGFCIGK